jgi:bisphosphoglycerate-dependent phosphoglycerate mutase
MFKWIVCRDTTDVILSFLYSTRMFYDSFLQDDTNLNMTTLLKKYTTLRPLTCELYTQAKADTDLLQKECMEFQLGCHHMIMSAEKEVENVQKERIKRQQLQVLRDRTYEFYKEKDKQDLREGFIQDVKQWSAPLVSVPVKAYNARAVQEGKETFKIQSLQVPLKIPDPVARSMMEDEERSYASVDTEQPSVMSTTTTYFRPELVPTHIDEDIRALFEDEDEEDNETEEEDEGGSV